MLVRFSVSVRKTRNWPAALKKIFNKLSLSKFFFEGHLSAAGQVLFFSSCLGSFTSLVRFYYRSALFLCISQSQSRGCQVSQVHDWID